MLFKELQKSQKGLYVRNTVEGGGQKSPNLGYVYNVIVH